MWARDSDWGSCWRRLRWRSIHWDCNWRWRKRMRSWRICEAGRKIWICSNHQTSYYADEKSNDKRWLTAAAIAQWSRSQFWLGKVARTSQKILTEKFESQRKKGKSLRIFFWKTKHNKWPAGFCWLNSERWLVFYVSQQVAPLDKDFWWAYRWRCLVLDKSRQLSLKIFMLSSCNARVLY